MKNVFLGIGTNEGDRLQNLAICRAQVEERIGGVMASSSVYETSAWGFDSEAFYNVVWQVESNLSPREILDEAKAIEGRMGRAKQKAEGYADRPIDIDLLSCEQMVLDEPGLKLPHPRIHMRNFVLAPWAEIAEGYIVPRYEKTVAALLQDCNDTGRYKRLSDV